MGLGSRAQGVESPMYKGTSGCIGADMNIWAVIYGFVGVIVVQPPEI